MGIARMPHLILPSLECGCDAHTIKGEHTTIFRRGSTWEKAKQSKKAKTARSRRHRDQLINRMDIIKVEGALLGGVLFLVWQGDFVGFGGWI
jgi:hypothetical protein